MAKLEKQIEGEDEYVKVIETNIVLKSKAEVEKEKVNLLAKKATIDAVFDGELAIINEQLAIFD